MANCHEPRVPEKSPHTNSLLAMWMYTTTSNNSDRRYRVTAWTCRLCIDLTVCRAASGFPVRMKVR